MSIVYDGTTFNNGGSATAAGTSLSEIRADGTTVWKKETIYERTVSANFPFYGDSPSAGSVSEQVISLPVGSKVTFDTITHIAGGATYQRFYIWVNGNTYVWGQSYNRGQNAVNLFELASKEGGWNSSASNLGPFTISTENRSIVIGIQGGAAAAAWQYGPGASHSESVYVKMTVT